MRKIKREKKSQKCDCNKEIENKGNRWKEIQTPLKLKIKLTKVESI